MLRSTFCLPAAAASLLTLLVAVGSAEATHLRGGTFWMEPTGAEDEARFGGTLNLINGPAPGTCYDYTGYGADLWLSGEDASTTGEGVVDLDLCVVHRDTEEGWTVNRLVAPDSTTEFTHTYPAPSTGDGPWRPFTNSCYRMQYGAWGEYVVNMQPGSDISVCQRMTTWSDLAVPNRAPRTFIPPIYVCTLDTVCTVPLSATDADGDELEFRVATSQEYAGSSGTYFHPGPPYAPEPAVIDQDRAALVWDTTGAMMADPNVCGSCSRTFYSVQVLVEDGRTQSVADFFIEVVDLEPPQWVTPPSSCGRTIDFTVGEPGRLDLRLEHADPDRLVQWYLDPTTPSSAAPGLTLAAIASGTSGVDIRLDWTPGPDMEMELLPLRFQGYSRNSYAPPCDVTIRVLPPPPTADLAGPGEVCIHEPAWFVDASTPGSPLAPLVDATWSWGDGSAGSIPWARHVSHTYVRPGAYEVLLQVADALGRTATASTSVTVCRPPEPEPGPAMPAPRPPARPSPPNPGRDADADGIPDPADNCPGAPNRDQEDADLDGTGDACQEPTGPEHVASLDGACPDEAAGARCGDAVARPGVTDVKMASCDDAPVMTRQGAAASCRAPVSADASRHRSWTPPGPGPPAPGPAVPGPVLAALSAAVTLAALLPAVVRAATAGHRP